MSSKWAVGEIVREHYSTFVDAETRKPHLADYLGMVVVPAGAGVALGLRGAHIEGIGDILAGVAVFTGGLFVMLIQVFPLAQRLSDDPRLAGQRRIAELVDELEKNLSYAVVIGLVTVGLLMAAAAMTSTKDKVSPAMTGALVAVLLHLLLTTFMTLKRLRAVYVRMRM